MQENSDPGRQNWLNSVERVVFLPSRLKQKNKSKMHKDNPKFLGTQM